MTQNKYEVPITGNKHTNKFIAISFDEIWRNRIIYITAKTKQHTCISFGIFILTAGLSDLSFGFLLLLLKISNSSGKHEIEPDIRVIATRCGGKFAADLTPLDNTNHNILLNLGVFSVIQVKDHFNPIVRIQRMFAGGKETAATERKIDDGHLFESAGRDQS
jgi:hypothetical protein